MNQIETSGGRFVRVTDDAGVHILTKDRETGLEWAAEPLGPFTNAQNGSEVEAACAGLQVDRGGWRAPSLSELQAIVDGGRSNPAIDREAFPICPPAFFWTSSGHSFEPAQFAAVVLFDDGSTAVAPRKDSYLVRPVRSQ